ncbi:MAG: T9SS type A sorting domain-containing protein [Ignavibacteria bacterium]|nr:T9SS type A sorting domain-containing protein [Ignavibacteria bacterium]
MKRFTTIVGVFVLLLIVGTSAWAQVSSEFWIRVDDSFGNTGTRYFGNHINAHYGIDDSLNPAIKEAEYPPPAFSFDARWVNIPGHLPATSDGGMGSGIIPWDYRPVPSNPTQKDTFKLAFQYSDQLLADFTFTWPDATYLMARCDSMFLVDPTRCALPTNINMFLQNSLTLTAPQSCDPSPVMSLRIYKYGARTIDAVTPEKPSLPAAFALHQNFPNPFNPTTTISFDVVKSAVTEISVYNMLGQKISTLVSQEYAPGSYTTEWNGLTAQGRPAASGVYYVRMMAKTTGASGVEQFSALRKLLLMK